MKKIAIILVLSTISILSFSQSPDYSVTLTSSQSFSKLSRKQITDSLNLNQTGPEQFEYSEIYLTSSESNSVDSFMKNCKSIQSIIDKYGRIEFDVTMGSNSNIIKPLSGFYYSVENIKTTSGYQLTLTIIYPRIDHM
jgi:hypothetical protein